MPLSSWVCVKSILSVESWYVIIVFTVFGTVTKLALAKLIGSLWSTVFANFNNLEGFALL